MISGGKPWSDEEIAGAVRGDYSTNLRDIAELLDKGVAFRDSRGAIFCKRMVRDEQLRRAAKCRKRKSRTCHSDVTAMSANASGDGIEVLKLSSEPKPQKPKKQEFILPDWVPREAWEGFEEMRRKISKPMTDRARKIALGKLAELKSEGHSPELVLNQSVMNDYQGLWPLKGGGNGQSKAEQRRDANLRAAEGANRILEKMGY